MNCLKYICITVILSYSNVLFASSEYLSSVEFMYNLSQEYNGELLDASLKGTHDGICDALKATNDKNTCMQYIGPDLASSDDESEIKNYHYMLSINSDNDDYSIAKQNYSESNDDSTLNTDIEMSADEKNSLIKIFKDHKLLHDDYQLPQHKVKKLSNAA